MLVVQMVSTCNFWLNIYPPTDGISRSINPCELLTGVKIDYHKHVRAEFGEYVQVHEEHDNSMHTRTTGAIATKPTGNAQGGHWFYSLTTGRMLDRQKWTPLPMPAKVIARIDVLAKAGHIGMHFTTMQNTEYAAHADDSDDDLASDDSDSDDSDYDDASSDVDDNKYDDFIAGVNGNNLAHTLNDDGPIVNDDADENDNDHDDDDNEHDNDDENNKDHHDDKDDDNDDDHNDQDDLEDLVLPPSLRHRLFLFPYSGLL